MFPALLKVRQEISAPEIPDPISSLRKKMERFRGIIQSGEKVAIACGSRGISRPGSIIKAVVDWVKSEKGRPFIVPAMGSHGAATSEGQKRVLAALGISESTIGCPVRSQIQAQKIGALQGVGVFTDRFALKADHLILVNRIKPHTSFHGRYESGLCKMLAVGLGKRRGAEEMHKAGPARLAELIPKVAGFVLQKLPLLFGVALLENHRERIALLEVLAPGEFLKREPELLEKSWKLLPRLPFQELEVLVVDELGKDKSGTGMDTNVIGRLDLRGMPEPSAPTIRRIVVLGISKPSQGSAYGLGLADITTREVVDQLDYEAMRQNALASGFPERARIPLFFNSDREAIAAAIHTCWCPEPDSLRFCRIKSTLELEEFWCTENLLAQSKIPLQIISRKSRLRFNSQGKLIN